MRILYAASEVAPFAKTGGLADVAGALPSALARLGHDVKVIMPKYGSLKGKAQGITKRDDLSLRLADQVYQFTLDSVNLSEAKVEVLFLGNDRFFDRPGLYQENGKDYPDNLERFAAFSRAVLEVPGLLDWHPDLIHYNDWQTALIPAYLNAYFASNPEYRRIGTLFTIHNLGYQGLFLPEGFSGLGLTNEYFTPETLEFYGKVNLLKAGLIFGGVINTVSPTYSSEIQTPEFGCGLEGVLQARRDNLFGIINGVDYDRWDPAHDSHIKFPYDSLHLQGKRLCKAALQKECNLSETDAPLIGMITRLTPQKGVDLVIKIIDELMRLDLQMVILGDGDPDICRELGQAMKRYPKRLSVRLAFDDGLAHRIEAGSDIFLMPSRYEPCGLNQLYSLRYGTVPIVRKTGGLVDTVIDATPSNIASNKATGFIFEQASAHELLNTVRLAVKLYQEKDIWRQLIRAGMKADFSWDKSAKEYEKLYLLAIKKAAGLPSPPVEQTL